MIKVVYAIVLTMCKWLLQCLNIGMNVLTLTIALPQFDVFHAFRLKLTCAYCRTYYRSFLLSSRIIASLAPSLQLTQPSFID